jgi:hypothetical protein
MVDTGKIFEGSKVPLIASLLFNLVLLGAGVMLGLLGFGAGAVAGKTVGAGVGMIGGIVSWGLAIVGIIGNLAIMIYAGYNAAKKGNDMVSCGLVGLTVYAIVGLIIGVLNIIVGFLGIGASVATSGNATMGLFSGFLGAAGLGVGILCGLGWYVAGLVVNFVIALVGGLIGGAK